MVKFDKFTLKNGLKVIVHNDPSTTIVAINVLYNVGARDENQDKTGFAHLFEHLMFEGSINIPSAVQISRRGNCRSRPRPPNYWYRLRLPNKPAGRTTRTANSTR